jgi:hypothetical protein
MRIREGHYASDNTDYERWAFAHFLADELISLIEEQGMLPPAQEYLIVDYKISPKGERYWNGDFAKKYVNEWEPEEKSDETI